jgi:hypothetical protein
MQRELPEVDQAFNLAAEVGDDPDRLIKQRLDRAIAAAAQREYELKMQRTFKECPGFCGSDDASHVVVDPALAMEARAWLRRRFVVNDAIELCDTGLCLEVLPRRARNGARRPRQRSCFEKPKQFELGL